MKTVTTNICLLIAMFIFSAPASAGLQEGEAAFKKRDFGNAMAELKPLAQKGNPRAQSLVSEMLYFGWGFPVNKSESLKWDLKAAAGGEVNAQRRLNVSYAFGGDEGVEQNMNESIKWGSKAAQAGDKSAIQNMANYFSKQEKYFRSNILAYSLFMLESFHQDRIEKGDFYNADDKNRNYSSTYHEELDPRVIAKNLAADMTAAEIKQATAIGNELIASKNIYKTLSKYLSNPGMRSSTNSKY